MAKHHGKKTERRNSESLRASSRSDKVEAKSHLKASEPDSPAKVITFSSTRDSKGQPKIRELIEPSEALQMTSLFNIWVVSLVLKVLLFVGYHSTDFDVHRNWLAITNKLPLLEWYTEDTSQWTLDYPPFFAYFEWFLSQFVPSVVARDGCLDIVEVSNYAFPTVVFQRTTVIVSEIMLFVALKMYVSSFITQTEKNRALVVALSLVLSPGLLFLDHMHFQYNGMMYGILVMVIGCARLQKFLWCGFWFSVLLCFKHIYLYLAPAVFIFLLRAYTLNFLYDKKRGFFHNVVRLVRWKNLFKLSSVVTAVFALAFGPFAYHHQIPNLLERLFPFSRGLTHAYWAPNAWAIYSFCDRFLIQIYKRIPLSRNLLQTLFHFDPEIFKNQDLINSTTRGIVGDIEFIVLPTITPRLSFFLTLFYQVMALIPLFMQPTYERFIGALTLCAYASFIFGWHVHEKAILIVIFPAAFLVLKDIRLLDCFSLLLSCGHLSLFPLIYTCEEWLLKVVYALLWYIIFHFCFRKVANVSSASQIQVSNLLSVEKVSSLFILASIPVLITVSLIELLDAKFEILKKLRFMKLMIISIYCGVGVISSWNRFNWLYFIDESIWKESSN